MIKEIMLLIYVIVFLLYILIKSIVFHKKQKINPFSFINSGFKESFHWWILFLILITYAVLISLNYFGLFSHVFSNLALDISGFILLLTGFLIVITAHAQMSKSWRMGIDRKTKTKLINTGLFRHSRNPVYLGLIIQSLAVFLLILNLTTLILFVLLLADLILIISSEEKFLEKQFGKEYLSYKKKVRRFI